MSPFRGLVGFPITPADEQGRVDTEALRRLLRRLVEARVPSIGLLGSTGTYAYLDRAERRRAVEAAVGEVAGRMPLLVGIGALRTDEAVRLGEDARDAGAAGVLLAPVSYTPLTEDEVYAHYASVAEAVRLPLCVYDNPGTTHFSFSAALIGRLSRLPYIEAVKTPAPSAALVADHLRALRGATEAGFSVGCSVDWHAQAALRAGGDAWYSVAGGLFPGRCLQIVDALARGNDAAAAALDAKLQPLWDLFTEFSSLRVMYACANFLGLSRAAPPRPILPLPEPVQHRIAAVVEQLDLA
ncbi:dihydrodipicolinate synthase family protein [Lichenicoccus sp.]|uniref:dihydrodipicolinate synthase family protein n=1 Tax=Lichenicoccus sp. TaxID=2781899 RepID=UPI003D11B1DB